MSVIFNTPLEQIVKNRTSIRTYTNEPISQDIKDKINKYINQLSGPFSAKTRVKLLESDLATDDVKLGTYGIIKGAKSYLGVAVEKGDLDLEQLGYEFEKLVLYVTSLGLGTCWLGGTFNKGEFSKAMETTENEIFPIVSPVGHATDKRRLLDSFMRFAAKSKQRKDWNELFFTEDFSTPLAEADSKDYTFALEMLRLAPSASNKQPWRVVKQGNIYHFYELKAEGYSDRFNYDIQRIDMGIGLCHFHLSVIEKDLKGEFKKLSPVVNNIPSNAHYTISWVCE
ncbi:nitroreductase family protein [Inconstantimicrobium mannanitabidum]|uniref:Nitroreductase n=1 Tax=Inconstantimicrobium mannanitabidum TaxID=1604901 RepID=A0ACB5REU2_9CLOT|nr:nitroreductase family protein [Clostridium sp. TW13]GKX67307.1 nitroreductase [Clostridium sp. TW13]